MTQNKYCSPLIYSIIFVLFRGSTSHDLEYAPFLLPILIFKYMHCNKPLSCSAHRIICYMGASICTATSLSHAQHIELYVIWENVGDGLSTDKYQALAAAPHDVAALPLPLQLTRDLFPVDKFFV